MKVIRNTLILAIILFIVGCSSLMYEPYSESFYDLESKKHIYVLIDPKAPEVCSKSSGRDASACAWFTSNACVIKIQRVEYINRTSLWRHELRHCREGNFHF